MPLQLILRKSSARRWMSMFTIYNQHYQNIFTTKFDTFEFDCITFKAVVNY